MKTVRIFAEDATLPYFQLKVNLMPDAGGQASMKIFLMPLKGFLTDKGSKSNAQIAVDI
jgi:hypothetical protein